ncbi:MAG: Asp-tRNA(Asn)/Glu-tRNA(Gln) amidotransferase subunit GatB [Acidobacteria bacterium]|nr:MAG: Asp-tRNA(Asn)/Glu-tRNA(Gln) amidotransferase subunit GatB [Acidobacteriota bacterium]
MRRSCPGSRFAPWGGRCSARWWCRSCRGSSASGTRKSWCERSGAGRRPREAPVIRRAPVIGLEVHARLRTATKLFCGCPVRADAPPNTLVCPVCLGLPGALPVPNREAVRLAVRLALALGARVHPVSEWDRKNYFYPDLPKGYQITQQRRPLATGGALDIGPPSHPVPLQRIHIEEDAGKSIHGRFPGGRTGLDFNRCGAPLVEVVTEPALASPEEAERFLERLKATLVDLGVSDAEMEKGSLRCDANVSLGPGAARVEIKNLNSFRNVRRALAYEIERLAGADPGAADETRAWDDRRRCTRRLRGKEHEFDYRYLPEPDLPPLRLRRALLAAAGRNLPEPIHLRIERYLALGVPSGPARDLAHRPALARYFDRAIGAGAAAREAAHWILGEAAVIFGEDGEAPRVPPETLAALVERVSTGKLSHARARRALRQAAGRGGDVLEWAEREARESLGDQDIEALCREILREAPDLLRRYRAGKTGLIDHFVGMGLRRSGGRADPGRLRRRLEALLRES